MNKIGISPMVLVIAAVLVLTNTGVVMAALWTDQADYSPGSTVTIHGDNSDNAGYQSGEIVNVSVNGPYQYDSKCNGNADSNGAWSCQVILSPDGTAVGQYIYTAVGQTSGVQQSGTFTDGFAVQFVETGLPSGISWSATLNGITKTASTPANVAFGNQGIGSYTYSVPIVSGTNIKYMPTPSSGSFSLTTSSSNPYQIPIGFTTQYQVSFAINPSGGGSTSPSNPAYYNAGSSIAISAIANTGYVFSSWSSSSTTSITMASTSSATSTATINGPGTITANFVLADNTPPVITPTVTGTKGANDWYVNDVSVSWTVSDPESAITSSSGCGNTNINTDTTGTVITCTATSTGGTSSQSVTIKRDATPPITSLSVTSGTIGVNGWYTSDVTVSTTGSASTSGLVGCSPDQYQTAETTGTTFNGICTNNAGVSTVATLTIKLDKTGPSGNLAVVAGTLGTNGWYTSDVTVSITGSDSISSPVTCTADQYQTTETTGGIFNGKCTNDAGLFTDASPLTVKLDKTGPSANLAVTVGTLGDNGWYKSDITVSTSGTDPISSPVICSADQFQTTETAGAVFNGKCTNDAGLYTDAAPLTVKLDKTPPTISGTAISSPNPNGWYNADVTIHFTYYDSLSGMATDQPDITISEEGAGLSRTGTVKDNAGNTASYTISGINIDETSPTMTISRSPDANSYGWNNGPVTVTFTAADSLSGIDGDSSISKTLSSEGAGQTANQNFKDKAGNTVTGSISGINIDLTKPTLVFGTATPVPNAAGWNNVDVSLPFTAGDVLSDVATTSPSSSPLMLTSEGSAVTGTVIVTDKAGNSETFTSPAFKIDKTKPPIDIVAPANGQIYTLKQTVASNYDCPDSLSGIASCTGPIASGSNFDTTSVGSKTFTVNAVDVAGNTNSVSNTYKVQYSDTLGRKILPPLEQVSDFSGLTKAYKIGSTLPIKFQLADDTGIYVGTAYATLAISKVSSSTDTGDLIVVLPSGSSDTGNVFRYDPTGQQYIYNLKTTGYTIGFYRIVVTLDDGTTIVTYFEMKK